MTVTESIEPRTVQTIRCDSDNCKTIYNDYYDRSGFPLIYHCPICGKDVCAACRNREISMVRDHGNTYTLYQAINPQDNSDYERYCLSCLKEVLRTDDKADEVVGLLLAIEENKKELSDLVVQLKERLLSKHVYVGEQADDGDVVCLNPANQSGTDCGNSACPHFGRHKCTPECNNHVPKICGYSGPCKSVIRREEQA